MPGAGAVSRRQAKASGRQQVSCSRVLRDGGSQYVLAALQPLAAAAQRWSPRCCPLPLLGESKQVKVCV